MITFEVLSLMEKSCNTGIYSRARSRAESAKRRERQAKTNFGTQYLNIHILIFIISYFIFMIYVFLMLNILNLQ